MKKRLVFPLCMVVLSWSEDKKIMGDQIRGMSSNLPYIQGGKIQKHGTAESIGMATLIYEKWSKHDKKLILCGKSIGNGQTIDFCDTLKILKLSKDSLITSGGQNYVVKYYKVNNLSDTEGYNLEQ